jgi:hypothetical protein
MSNIIDELQRDLDESMLKFKEEIQDTQESLKSNNDKPPATVFNNLVAIVEKQLHFLPQQPAMYAVFALIRDNPLVHYLFNMCIHLGKIDSPLTLINEFKKMYQQVHPNQNLSFGNDIYDSDELLSPKNQKKLGDLLRLQKRIVAQSQEWNSPKSESCVSFTIDLFL